MKSQIAEWVAAYNLTAETKVQIKNVALFADKVVLLCHYLLNSQCPYSYISVHSSDLKKLLGKNRGNNYQRVILCASALGLIKVDLRYQRGHHTRRYQLQSVWNDRLNGKFQTRVNGTGMLLKMAHAYERNETVATAKISFITLQLLFGTNFYASLVLLQVSGQIRFSGGKDWCKVKLVKNQSRMRLKNAEKAIDRVGKLLTDHSFWGLPVLSL